MYLHCIPYRVVPAPCATRTVWYLYPVWNLYTCSCIEYLYCIPVLYIKQWCICYPGKRDAWLCCLLFCFNPASIFMSAAYTECTFALYSFALMFYVEQREYTKATIALALATATRSNGLLLAGYPLYQILKHGAALPNNHFASYVRLFRYVTILLNN